MLDFNALMTLGDVTRAHAAERPDATAFEFEGRRTSFAALEAHTNQVAHALAAAGVQQGQRIAYLGKNSDHYFELLLGAAKAGVVMVPVGWRLAPPEIAFIVDNAEAQLLFVGGEFAELVAAMPELAAKTVIAMEPGSRWPTYEAWRDAQPVIEPDARVKSGDVTVQLYTSGTTGKPKGAMLTHDNLLTGRKLGKLHPMPWNDWGPEDVSLVAMPVAHIGGTGWGLVGLVNGAKGSLPASSTP